MSVVQSTRMHISSHTHFFLFLSISPDHWIMDTFRSITTSNICLHKRSFFHFCRTFCLILIFNHYFSHQSSNLRFERHFLESLLQKIKFTLPIKKNERHNLFIETNRFYNESRYFIRDRIEWLNEKHAIVSFFLPNQFGLITSIKDHRSFTDFYSKWNKSCEVRFKRRKKNQPQRPTKNVETKPIIYIFFPTYFAVVGFDYLI